VAATELYTQYLLGDRDRDTFKAFVLRTGQPRSPMRCAS
jgi:hypothetical protein